MILDARLNIDFKIEWVMNGKEQNLKQVKKE